MSRNPLALFKRGFQCALNEARMSSKGLVPRVARRFKGSHPLYEPPVEWKYMVINAAVIAGYAGMGLYTLLTPKTDYSFQEIRDDLWKPSSHDVTKRAIKSTLSCHNSMRSDKAVAAFLVILKDRYITNISDNLIGSWDVAYKAIESIDKLSETYFEKNKRCDAITLGLPPENAVNFSLTQIEDYLTRKSDCLLESTRYPQP
ncbi:MAG: hypothetical protein COB66_02030 [Coxiella sp. (in: Bacteria)]|nr:MAG: hypothetical protein COB66_02030 [Coxiella sp. (in: g-proteobacteria)]